MMDFQVEPFIRNLAKKRLLSGTVLFVEDIGLLGAKEDIQLNPYSPRTNISISISMIYKH